MRSFARILILSTVVIWIIYDIYTYIRFGNPSTESATLVRMAYYHPYFPFLLGLLCGHTMFDLREPIDWSKDLTK